MSPDNNDLDKIINGSETEIIPKIYTLGHRNPQGLFINKDKVIFETEHGPYGGDELNIIKEYCVNNQLSKVLYNSSLTFLYPVIDEIPMLDPFKAIPIGGNS